MRILGIDFGDAKIGIAISDPFGWTAQGIETLYYRDNIMLPINKILGHIRAYVVDKVVVGYPRNMNGTVGTRCEKTEAFMEELVAAIADLQLENSIDVIKWDERLSTAAAKRLMIETGVKKGKKKGIEDQVAAVYILQGYLDSIGKNTGV